MPDSHEVEDRLRDAVEAAVLAGWTMTQLTSVVWDEYEAQTPAEQE